MLIRYRCGVCCAKPTKVYHIAIIWFYSILISIVKPKEEYLES